jgi:hypothetical protein
MKITFKSIIYNFVLFGLLMVVILAAAACGKDFLKPKPLSIYTPDNTYATAAALQDAIVACERCMSHEFLGDGAPILTQMIFSDVAVDGSTDKSSPSINISKLITPDAKSVNSVSDVHNRIYWYWGQNYKMLKYANTVLAYINIPKWDTTNASQLAQKNALIGAAYFFRAYAYYSLCNSFGNVPYAAKLFDAPKLDFQTVDRKVILAEMKKELEFAVKWVPDGSPKGQVSKGACLHMLTKINLALGNFDEAIKSASQLIDGGAYHLMTARFGVDKADPTKNVIWDLHRPQNKVLPENTEGLMYVIDLDGYKTIGADNSGGSFTMRNATPSWDNSINTPTGNRGTVSQIGGDPAPQTINAGRGIARCRGTWYSTHEIWSDDSNDYRHSKGNWMSMSDYVYNNPALEGKDTSYLKPLQEYNAAGQLLCSDTIRCWFGWPYYKLYVADNENVISTGGHTPWYVFRLAGTYLLRAEAYFWKGDLVDAAADINVVRARANAHPISPSDVNRGTILDQRDRELYYEELRHEELVRISYLFAQTGKSDYKGRSYNMANFSKNNFWYNRIIDKTEFYNKGIRTKHGDEYKISPYNVLFPIPQSAIDANSLKQINQNEGYTGVENNVAPLETLPTD